MNATEAINHEKYKKCLDRIKSFKKGFIFTLYYDGMTKEQIAFFNLLTRGCIKMGLIKSIGIYLNLDDNITNETFKRL